MAGETPITIVGRLTADAEAQIGKSSGKQFLTLSVATSPRTFDRNTNSWKDGETSYYDVIQFGYSAQFGVDSYRKGDWVIVTGTVQIKRFERSDGSKGTKAQVVANHIGLTSDFGVVTRQRDNQQGGYSSAPPPQQNAAPQQQAPMEDPFAASAPAPDNNVPGW